MNYPYMNCSYCGWDVKYIQVPTITSHHRRSIRLEGYDYSQPGAYFLTLVTHQREALFGEIVDGEMRLNPLGKLVEKCWQAIPIHFVSARLNEFVIMPNHLHGIIFLCTGEASAGFGVVGKTNVSPADASPLRPIGTKSGSLGAIIQNFKSISTRLANSLYFNPGSKLWQRNYYEHIIRNERELNEIRKYIQANPIIWENDKENPQALSRRD